MGDAHASYDFHFGTSCHGDFVRSTETASLIWLKDLLQASRQIKDI